MSVDIIKTRLKSVFHRNAISQLNKLNWGWLMLHGRKSFSQNGEDLLLAAMMLGRPLGFYVDIGACHPTAGSNTYYFYRRGWTGLCIDPLPGSGNLWRRKRPRDIFLPVGISDSPGELRFYRFSSPYYNSFDPTQIDEAIRDGYSLVASDPVKVVRLDQAFSENRVTDIDFMSVDVERVELQVLQSNDWSKWRPLALCIELKRCDLSEVPQHPVGKFLFNQGYRMSGKIGDDCFFQREELKWCDRDLYGRWDGE